MYYTKQIHHENYVRFRRWSRKGYAVFSSLSQNVSIGKVCNSICDSALRKTSHINEKNDKNILSQKQLEESEEESAEYNDSLLLQGRFNLRNIINPTHSLVGVAKHFIYPLLINPAVDIRNSYINRIFYENL